MGRARRLPGWTIALGLLLLGIAAGMGTCSRFTSNNLVTREVVRVSERGVVAVFPAAAAQRLRPGLPAKISAQGDSQLFDGEVIFLEAEEGVTRAQVRFSHPLPFSAKDWVLSVEVVPPASR